MILSTNTLRQLDRTCHDDCLSVIRKLAERIGPPAYLITDGAVELIESADALQIEGKTPVVLRDMKHFAANVFEKLIGKDERFKEFQTRLGRTRSAIQQTELSHFTHHRRSRKLGS